MSEPNLETLLGNLLSNSVKELLKRIEAGTATPADLSVARAILRDNNITASNMPGGALDKLNQATKSFSLPTISDDTLEPPEGHSVN